MKTLAALSRALEAGETTSVALVREALDRILDPEGQGDRVFTMIDPERSVATAERMDALRAAGQALLNGRAVSGGSTLTMQVARLLEDGSTGRWAGKLRQIRVALALEQTPRM